MSLIISVLILIIFTFNSNKEVVIHDRLGNEIYFYFSDIKGGGRIYPGDNESRALIAKMRVQVKENCELVVYKAIGVFKPVIGMDEGNYRGFKMVLSEPIANDEIGKIVRGSRGLSGSPTPCFPL